MVVCVLYAYNLTVRVVPKQMDIRHCLDGGMIINAKIEETP